MAERLNPDNCVVLDRDEALAELERAHDASYRLAFNHGMVGGMISATCCVGLILLTGGALDAVGLLCGFAAAGCIGALWWRIWDASGTTVTLMGWELKNFAAALYDQAQEEARGGRADG